MTDSARTRLMDVIQVTLQQAAKARSRDGMTGISDVRARGLALEVVDTLGRNHVDLVAEWLVEARR
jgi:predicted acyl esterase